MKGGFTFRAKGPYTYRAVTSHKAKKPRNPGTGYGAVKRKAERLVNDAIKKLEPYQQALTQVALKTTAIKRARRALDDQLTERRAALLEARDLGAPRADLANAAGVSLVRVSQILAGGAR